jgi:hypothetical protein
LYFDHVCVRLDFDVLNHSETKDEAKKNHFLALSFFVSLADWFCFVFHRNVPASKPAFCVRHKNSHVVVILINQWLTFFICFNQKMCSSFTLSRLDIFGVVFSFVNAFEILLISSRNYHVTMTTSFLRY